jgi:Tol biopolymer transport system component
VHWVLPVPRPVDAARWSPDGFRIAYRLSGGGLYVVAGDGTGPRLLDQSWRTLAWRPGPGHVLAYARGTTVRIVDTDSRRLLGRLRTRAVPSALAWSADGQRLVASDGRTLSLADATGRTLRRVPFAGIRARSMAFAPRGSQLAAVRVLGGHSEVTVLDASTGRSRVLFAGVGTFSDLAWSPDGRWLLVGWHDADQWLFIPLRSGQRLTAVANVATQFGSPGAFPAVSGWAPSG